MASTSSTTTRKRLKVSTVNCNSGVKNNNIPSRSSTLALLPDGIQILLLNKLDVVGFHRFGAVCRQWQSIATAANKIRHRFLLKPQFPWLMLSYPESEECHHHHKGFFSLFHNKVIRLKMPKIRGARCCGSSWGWLIMLSNNDGRMFLLNPFTRIHIKLPRKSTLPCLDYELTYDIESNPNYIRKVMLLSPPSAAANHSNLDENPFSVATDDSDDDLDEISSPVATDDLDENPSSVAADDCLVVAIYCSRHLTFCRPGDKAWTALTERFIVPQDLGYEDLIVYQGKLYAIKFNYDLILLELSPQPKETSCNIAPPPMEKREHRSLYLVKCCGELLVVTRWTKFIVFEDLTRDYDEDAHRPTTIMFKVYKLDLQHRWWIKVEDLGDQMLFIGTSTGVSISALDYPGFEGNSIYFTDDLFHCYAAMWPAPPQGERAACYDLGVFHLQDKSIGSFFSNASHSYLSAPIWFTPVSW